MQTTNIFKSKLSGLKTSIDTELAVHSKNLRIQTTQKFTPYSAVGVDAYNQILARGGKRIRGALTIIGYEMCGGKDSNMILQAACAIEMIHAYLLVLDDIMDKSKMRRGGPSAHILLADYHKKNQLAGNAQHFGVSVAINAALIGSHYAQCILTGLNEDSDLKLRALSLLNEAIIVTGHGQINDIFNEVVDEVDERAVDQVLEWKTAQYTFLNPLQFGMTLAGADKTIVSSVYDYSMHAGRAFQITDDILGTFASEQEAGKSPMDDIREGKRTVLSVEALSRSDSGDKNFLIQMLGNEKLTYVEFTRCKEIFVETGAFNEANKQAVEHVASAKKSLYKNSNNLSAEGVEFLDQLVTSLLGRNK